MKNNVVDEVMSELKDDILYKTTPTIYHAILDEWRALESKLLNIHTLSDHEIVGLLLGESDDFLLILEEYKKVHILVVQDEDRKNRVSAILDFSMKNRKIEVDRDEGLAEFVKHEGFDYDFYLKQKKDLLDSLEQIKIWCLEFTRLSVFVDSLR